MQLYLIRHGQSFMNLEEWIAIHGYNNAGLTDLGHQQAAALGKWLPTMLPDIDVVYASTMLRARETVAYIADAFACDISFDDRLREIGASRHDHTPWSDEELPGAWADYWYSERPFAPVALLAENSESMMHFRTRVGIFIEDIVARHKGQIVVVVCHGGVVEAAFDHIFNIGRGTAARSGTTIRRSPILNISSSPDARHGGSTFTTASTTCDCSMRHNTPCDEGRRTKA